jgi:hypothetical protein
MKLIKLNGDLVNLEVKNGLLNKSLIKGFCFQCICLKDVLNRMLRCPINHKDTR